MLIRYDLIDEIKQNNIEVKELENIINVSSSQYSNYEYIKNKQ